MKIGMDLRMREGQSAGIGRYAFELLISMLDLKTDNEFVVFYNQKSIAKTDLDKLDQYENALLVPTNIRHYSWQEQVLLPRILNKHEVSIMHFPNFNVPIWYRGPYVVTIHDMVHHRISGHKKSHYLHFQGYKYIMQKAVERAKAVIAPSKAAKKDIAHYFPASEQKISVIYEGPNLKPVAPEMVVKVKDQFLLRRPYFLFVGTLERKKNTVMLARAFDEFLEKYKLDMDLVFAGKVDQHYPEEKDKILSIKHRDRVVFTGYVDDAVLSALYQGAYAFVSSSLNEGFGLPGVEAMQFGLPVVVSNTEVFNEVYDTGAIYFDGTNIPDIADKMHLVARDQQFYEQLRQKSLERSVVFNWQGAAKATLALYKKALTSDTPRLEAVLE